MKALIQRVSEASVEVDGKIVSQINQGMLVLLGITHSDSSAEVDRLVRKIPALRIIRLLPLPATMDPLAAIRISRGGTRSGRRRFFWVPLLR